MPNIAKVQVVWNGVPGGGVSTFYGLEADGASLASDVRDFFQAIRDAFSPAVTLVFPTVGDVIDSATGSLVGAWTGGALADVTGNSSNPDRAAGVGCRVQWETGAVIGGRRVRGATYLTELGVAAYDPDGTLDFGVQSAIQTAATALAAAGTLIVWSRPGPNGSGTSSVLSATVADRVSSLRSRRV